MWKFSGDVVQAVPLMEGQVNVGVGTYTAKSIIHADVDCTITLPFTPPINVDLVGGEDRAYVGRFTVLSGTVTYA